MRVVGLQTHIWQNNFKSLALLLLFPAILILIVYLIIISLTAVSETGNAPISALEILKNTAFYILVGTGMWFIIAWLSHQKIISNMTHANQISRQENPRVYNIVENLCISRGMPMPKIYVIEDTSLNAYASGLTYKNSLIAFSRGILNKLNDKELEAVAAHELTHIINMDVRLMVICIIFVGIIQTISEFFLHMRINPSRSDRRDSGNSFVMILFIKLLVFLIGFIFTLLVQMAISRKREHLADAGSVELTKSSKHLISALEKISQDPRIEAIENRSVAQLCIENPLAENKGGILSRLFSTHPPIQERIEILRKIG